MLRTLRIRNLALVENVAVEFQPGLNVITGETGAGKSLLIGALNLLLGDRADRTLIRTGEEQCLAEAVFELSKPAGTRRVLEELGIESVENGQILIRRTLSMGNSRQFLNDTPTTLLALRKVGERLVDMHGPHDHQSLLNAAFQLNLLDAFARLEGPLTDYQDAYRLMRDLEDRRQALDGDDQQVVRQIDLLSFQVREIESAAPVDGEDAQIEKEQALIANAQRILQLAEAIRNALTEGENAAFGHLTFVQKAFAELIPLEPTASAWRDEARSIAIQLQELASDISRYAQHMDADPQRLQWLEDRMALYHKLKRKYGATVPQILEHLAQAKQQLHDLETRGEQIAKIETQLAAARKVVMDLGRQLGKRRRAAAEKLAAAITKELRDLGFKDGSFHVELREGEPTASGTDEIEFGFAPNVGESLRPLRAIASSGEISRVMLAVKAVLAAHDPIPVLVFDEIDINIGGETANAVGAKLAEVARNHQVLCITHLPQVAIHGTAHFAVSKEVSGNRTRTQIRQLDMEQRAEEIARMLGGKDLTSVTLKHAREMIRNVPSSRR